MKKRVSMWRCILNDERLRILKLLEEGKINAEEAARLLEALSHSEERTRKRRFWKSIEVIPDVVSSAISSSFKYTTEKETLQFAKKKYIEFKGISGDLEVIGSETDKINIEKDGMARIQERDDKLEIRAISGDMKIMVPKATHFAMKSVSGDLRIMNVNGEIEVASVSGDIAGQELSGSLDGKLVSGNIEADYKKVEKIKIRARTGDIVLKIDKNVEAEVEAETKTGEIECAFELTDKIEDEHYLKGIIKKPKAKIELKNQHGNIAIKKRNSG